MGRRRLLGLGLAGATSALVPAALSGCRPATQPRSHPSTQASEETTGTSPRVLVAYFSRAGENYSYGDRTWLEVDNTQVVAEMIAGVVPCDLHRIEAAEPYPDDYDQTVDRNVREQNDDARPEIANPIPAIDQYDVVLLGSPIWNLRAPMIMSTFTEGLAVQGEEAQAARPAVTAWLRRIRLAEA